MNYCALDDAFRVATPGCESAKRKEARKAKRRCQADKDGSQQVQQPQQPQQIPAMNPSIGLRDQVYDRSLEPFIPDTACSMYEMPKNIPAPNESQQPCPGRSKFFGADPEEPFANYVPDAEDYRLKPDFLKAFEESGVARAGSTAIPDPATNMYWKPLTTSGAQTSFMEKPLHYYRPNGPNEISNDDIMKKLDKLWARLDDMNTSSPEQITSELLMFISSGIFVIFMMDLLVKKGSTLRF